MTDASRTDRPAVDPAGDLAAVVADLGGQPRAGQERMARAVAEALAEGTHLLVQAGTGTGKSVGYLVPALAHAVERGERVVVSTATLALQRQVLAVDAPRVADVIERRHGRRPTVALLKGWQNYLCRHKLDGGYPEEDDPGLFAALVPPAATGDDLADAATPAGATAAGAAATGTAPTGRPDAADPGPSRLAADVLRLRAWAEETDTGDRDDLVPGVTERAWRQVSVSKLECLGPRCPVRTEGYAEGARGAAAEADVVVPNHAMLGIAASGNPGVLPEFDALVVDEAHDLADRVTSAGTLEVSGATVRRAARLLAQAGVDNGALTTAAQALTGRLELTEEGRLPDGLPTGLRDAIVLVEAAAREAVSALKPSAAEAGTGGKDGGGDPAGGTRAVARAALVTLHEACERLLSDSVAQRRDVLWCARPRWEGRDGRENPPRLHLAPLDVAGPISGGLLSGRAVVATSATLALGGGFEPMARSLGMELAEEPWTGLDVGSPFDHARQGILYVARHLPPAGRDGTAPELLDELTELVRAAGGRTLGLFSSRRAAQAAAAHLREHLDTPVLCQGDDQLPTLVRAFAADEATTLVGTLSLWQGVDVPGPTCSLVVIDRIPFPRPDDPIRSARSEAVARAGGNGFMSVAASHAALLLAQGAGRLLRRGDDRGVVAVLDPRLVTARYGSFLVRSLPAFWRTTDREVVLGALRRLAADTDEAG